MGYKTGDTPFFNRRVFTTSLCELCTDFAHSREDFVLEVYILLPSRLCFFARDFRRFWSGLYRGDFHFVGHDQAFLANQGDSAVEQRGVGIVIANQFSFIQ
jgi:hypothetical protein